jgi:hypothetical protein
VVQKLKALHTGLQLGLDELREKEGSEALWVHFLYSRPTFLCDTGALIWALDVSQLSKASDTLDLITAYLGFFQAVMCFKVYYSLGR